MFKYYRPKKVTIPIFLSKLLCSGREDILQYTHKLLKKKLLTKLLFSILLYGDGRIDLIRDITIDDK